jgi:formylglycine-generating enzyme required for sulfatase activity
MLGNVYEWCQDQVARYPKSDNNTITDDIATKMSSMIKENNYILRGGSYNSPAAFLRSALRVKLVPSFRFSNDGFRLSRTYR